MNQEAYTGTGPDTADTGTTWNVLTTTVNPTNVALVNSSGASTGVSFTSVGNGQNWGGVNNPNALLNTFVIANAGNVVNTFTGLASGDLYDLYAISNNVNTGKEDTFTVNGISQSLYQPANFGTVTITSTSIYTEFVGLAATSGSLTIDINSPGATGNGQTNYNGFQLVPLIPVSSAGTYVWSGLAGSSGTGSWDTWSANWSSSTSSNYTPGGAVIFTDTGTNTAITITGSGVSPFGVQFTNNTTPYSFRVERSPVRRRSRSAGRAS